MKILITGDFYPKGMVDLKEFEVIKENSDYTITNFESPVVKEGMTAIVKCGPHLKSDETSVKQLKEAGFDCVTLANNHTLDYGREGIQNTIEVCREYGLDVVGAGKNLEEASKTLYKEIKGKTLAIINCCEHEFSIAEDDKAGTNPLNPIQQYYSIKEARDKADYVLVIVHGGHEGYQLPSPRMQEAYRFFIEAGADAVVNHHQHCYSGYEIYNGKNIFYGLGNFIFPENGNINNSWNEGYVLILDFEKDRFTIYPYIQCNGDNRFRFMSDEEREIFEDRIENINKIISCSKELKKSHENWMEQTNQMILSIFSPYTNRYMKALCKRGLLPKFISQKRVVRLLNYIDCESHRERVLTALKTRIGLR